MLKVSELRSFREQKRSLKDNMNKIAYTHIRIVMSMDFVYIFKTLADENRIRILNILRNGELCGCDIEAVLGIKQSNVSRHLNRLKIAGIIHSDKNHSGSIINSMITFSKDSPSFQSSLKKK